MTSVFHVATCGSGSSDGSQSQPLRTINRAAELARAGDSVVVHEGVYREWVRPRRGGLSDQRRITYEAASGEHVVIKGSEQVTGWEPVEGTVWKVSVPNSLFGSFNPFREEIDGDWIVYPEKDSPKKHLGDVYLGGLSFYEVLSLDEVSDPPRRTEVLDDWTEVQDRVRNLEQTQAACPWTPPTADQPGLIGPNWAKGWIIEDNVIHDAKCSAISIGKEASTGHNYATTRGDKPGYQYQLESVFAARQIGWDKEHIGSHVVRRNTIYDCGQNGIVGHLGCVFSTIEDNH